MGFIWNPTHFEAGIDGIIEIRDVFNEDATNFIIQVQSKATEQSFTADKGQTFEYICEERDLDYWLKGNCPVILIRSNVVSNEAYWVSIKEYFNDPQKRKSRKIVFDKSKHCFSVEAKSSLAYLAIPESSGYYLSPPPLVEKIYSNLLAISSYPTKIYEANTKYRKSRELWEALNQLEVKTGINKSRVLHEGSIFLSMTLAKHLG